VIRDLLDRLPDAERRRALTHASFAVSPEYSYERLEFLGDAVLDLAIAQYLYENHPEAAEGKLSQWRAQVVSRVSCAEVAREERLHEAMIENAPDDVARGLAHDMERRDTVLAALTESVIGAGFLALGYEEVAREILESFATSIGRARHNPVDSKSQLQEHAQRRGESVEYRLVSTDGPDHDRTFTVQARLAASGLETTGVGRTKKAAEQEAAERLLEELA
jgi:ribonuclease-3